MQEEKCLLSPGCYSECLEGLDYTQRYCVGPGMGAFAGLFLIVLIYILGQYAPRQSEAISFGQLVFWATTFFSAVAVLTFWLIDRKVKMNWCRHCR